MDIEEKVKQADHVKTNDETIVPGYLKRRDKHELKDALRSSLKSSVIKTSWLAVMMASMLTAGVTAGVPHYQKKELALDATGWTFGRSAERRAARTLLNEETPRCVLTIGVESNNYALELAKWQYRTGQASC